MNIYERHEQAFSQVSAYVLLGENHEQLGTVAVKSSGRVWAYVHFFGKPMRRASAGGGGYDRVTAAVAEAMRGTYDLADQGLDWKDQLRARGVTALRAV